MVDISSQEKKINITVSSGASNGNVNVTQDTAQFYSEKAREWAISNKIVDSVDYSSKYYANKSNQSALNAQSFAQSAQDSYNNVQNTAIKALDDIEADKTSAISEVNSTKSTALTDINSAKSNAVNTINATASSLANKDLSNLSVTGENKFNTILNNKITNCLLEVPQRIKLELNNGVLTLKSGSEVIVPSGFEADGVTPKFDYIKIEEDILQETGPGDKSFLFYNVESGIIQYRAVATSSSGESDPATNGSAYYQINQNIVNYYTSAGVKSKVSFPLAIVSGDTSKPTSIDQVFNGIGYIGSTVWIDKDVKGLAPNGKNGDGTLNNVEWTVPEVRTRTFDSGFAGYFKLSYNQNPLENGKYIGGIPVQYFNYVASQNINLETNSNTEWNYTPIAVATLTNGRISDFTPNNAFKAVGYSDNYWIAQQSMPSNKFINLTLGTSGTRYTAPTNGYYVLMGTTTAANGSLILSSTVRLETLQPISGWGIASYIPIRKNDVVQVNYNNFQVGQFRFVYAEGDK